ncbi:hypothetical protein AGMMS49975_25650 [Clostridia bacterium]|nr:hypothetical protein AGMMS49975_25650 [Clostridia bacterium]
MDLDKFDKYVGNVGAGVGDEPKVAESADDDKPTSDEVDEHFGRNQENYSKVCELSGVTPGDERPDNPFVKFIRETLPRLGAKLVESALFLYYGYQYLPAKDKAIIIGALGYLLSPIDLIPDALIPLGFVDDGMVLASAVASITATLNPETKLLIDEKLASIKTLYEMESESKKNRKRAEETENETEAVASEPPVSEIPETIGGVKTMRGFEA